ncbi:restriction endonuclease subunit S [Alkalicoccobacillus porphyridii]|uniref:Type I restriction modification DNA specificity domain-containing protein n=1 Tax=Alkalicoccobacillus porphyridii TaxID=2597270 RepID=A0A554A1Z8_9BACI|nr:restriction endonuclease subunit S [Alkalicoccobacillus porphyridii]TSB47695.1 hypothetical protein FN960_04035 [Alkalicoccobacillus porphyridii]
MSVEAKVVREGYKMTELGEMPEEWEVLELGEVSEVILGQSPLSESYNEEGIGLPFFQGKAEFGWKYPVVKKWCDQPKKIAEPGDILFSVRAPVGEINLCNQRSCIGRGLAAIRPSEISQMYLYFYLKCKKEAFSTLGQGSTFTAINGNDLRTTQLPLPPLLEQQKIAEILSTVDEQLETIEELIEKTKELKKGLMQRLLTKGIGHTEFKKTELGEIPVGWEVKSLKDIARVSGGKRLPKGKLLTEIQTERPYIRVADMFMGGIKDHDFYYVPNDVISQIERYRIFYGDLFISVAGSLGIVGEIPRRLSGANLTENADRISEITCDNIYLKYYLMSELIQKLIKREQTQNAQPKLALTRIKNFKIALPPLHEQQKIASLLSSVDEQLDTYENEKEKVTELKKGLMQQLLTGKIRVTV